MIAALYVLKDGCYFGLEGVDPWDEARDARLYDGPHSVVAHPPCERWGRYASGGPSHHGRFALGDDNGCFKAALAAVRSNGGVLEHPAGSKAWPAFGLAKPKAGKGWVKADDLGGITCRVEQGHYGHTARKPTWLYGFGIAPLDLEWGPSIATRSKDYGDRLLTRRRGAIELMSKRQRASTPAEFRDVLLELARSAGQ